MTIFLLDESQNLGFINAIDFVGAAVTAQLELPSKGNVVITFNNALNTLNQFIGTVDTSTVPSPSFPVVTTVITPLVENGLFLDAGGDWVTLNPGIYHVTFGGAESSIDSGYDDFCLLPTPTKVMRTKCFSGVTLKNSSDVLFNNWGSGGTGSALWGCSDTGGLQSNDSMTGNCQFIIAALSSNMRLYPNLTTGFSLSPNLFSWSCTATWTITQLGTT